MGWLGGGGEVRLLVVPLVKQLGLRNLVELLQIAQRSTTESWFIFLPIPILEAQGSTCITTMVVTPRGRRI